MMSVERTERRMMILVGRRRVSGVVSLPGAVSIVDFGTSCGIGAILERLQRRSRRRIERWSAIEVA